MFKSTRLALALAGGCVVGPASSAAWAQTTEDAETGSQAAPAAVDEMVTIPVTVADLDMKNRTLTVKTAEGDRLPLSVPPDVKAFETLKQGDKTDIDYYRAVATRILPSASPGASAQATAAGGKGPEMKTSSQVVSVDERGQRLTVKQPDGRTTVAVRDPGLQRLAQILRPGDVVDLTYTAAVLAGIHGRRP